MRDRVNHNVLNRSLIAIALLLSCGLTIPIAQAQAPQTPAPETATLNLNNADIRVLIDTVSAATGKNFIIDPRVKAKVTVVSAKPMGKDELYEVFLSILQVHGFAAVPSDGIIKIVPDANAKQDAVPTVSNNDTSLSDQLVTRVIVLQNVSANQLVPILRPLVPQQGHLAAYTPSNVLIVTDRAKNITRLVDVIRRIDRPDNEEVEVIRLEHASAGEIVRIVTTLQQQQTGAEGGAGGGPNRPILIADERTNSIMLGGDRAMRARVRNIIAQLDIPLSTGGNTKVIFLKYANAMNLLGILQGIAAKAAEQPQEGRPGVKMDIQADETNNALVITAPPAVIREMESLVRQLDIQRAQVLIEAIIAEVSTDLASELGAQLLVNGNNDGDGQGPIGGSLFNESFNVAALAQGTPSLGDGLTLGVGDTSGSTAFALILRALKGDTATNILSTPTLVTMDNVEAEIVFGQNVPFVTGSFANTGGVPGAANPFQTIERQDVGLTLKVKPQINEGDAIKMEIEQEVSSINASATASDVVTNKRAIRTQVMVEDGQTIVLGGLIEDRFSDSQRKVPILGSIPILGRLFSYTKTTKVKSNLMVFIRPVILDTIGAADHYTSQKYSLLRARQVEAKIGKRGLIRKGATELPEIEVLFTPLAPKTEKPATREPATTEPPQQSENRNLPATIEHESL